MKEVPPGKGMYSVAEYQVLSEGKPVSLSAWDSVWLPARTRPGNWATGRFSGFEEYMDFMKSLIPRASPSSS